MAIGTAPFDVGQRMPQVNTASTIRPHLVARNMIDNDLERLGGVMDTAAGNTSWSLWVRNKATISRHDERPERRRG